MLSKTGLAIHGSLYFTSSKNTKTHTPTHRGILLTPRAEIRMCFISLYWLQWTIPLRAMRVVWLSASETRTGRGRTPSLCDEPRKANHKVSLSKPIRLEWLASTGKEFLCLLSCRYKKVGRSRRERKNTFIFGQAKRKGLASVKRNKNKIKNRFPSQGERQKTIKYRQKNPTNHLTWSPHRLCL